MCVRDNEQTIDAADCTHVPKGDRVGDEPPLFMAETADKKREDDDWEQKKSGRPVEDERNERKRIHEQQKTGEQLNEVGAKRHGL
jgi:hypothetical protein